VVIGWTLRLEYNSRLAMAYQRTNVSPFKISLNTVYMTLQRWIKWPLYIL